MLASLFLELGVVLSLVLGQPEGNPTADVNSAPGSEAPQTQAATEAPEPAPAQPMTRAQIASVIEPILANPPHTGLLVFDVAPRSQAAKAGLKIGDIVTHYDGQPVTSIAELSELARQAFSGQPKSILVLVQRDNEEIPCEFEPAPLGLRMTAVEHGRAATLWRRPTTYQPDSQALASVLKTKHVWQRLTKNSIAMGWAHHYYTRSGNDFVQRTQSKITGDGFDERHDVTITFAANPYLSVRSVRITTNDKTILDAKVEGEIIHGERLGIPVESTVPKDAVSFHLANLVAAMMPQENGACLRCSYLDAGSLSAAPFADLYCFGTTKLPLEGEVVDVYRYEQTVFGETVAEFWIDTNRKVVRSQQTHGLESTLVSQDKLAQEFPEMENTFPAIEQLPAPPIAPPQAN